MKKIFSLLASLLVVFGSYATADLNYNANEVDKAFSKINKLEAQVNASDHVSVEQYADVLETESFSFAPTKELPANIPAFWWGFCLGWVGLLLVYILTDNDKDQVKTAFKGCIIGTLVGLGIYLIVVVIGLGAGVSNI